LPITSITIKRRKYIIIFLLDDNKKIKKTYKPKMIVLLTDFGQGEHVGVMKGVIRSKTKKEEIMDLYHDIKPQNILQASWILLNNHSYFPKKTVFCCVVDPGVGTNRKALAIKTKDYYFIGPDNGLFWDTIKEIKYQAREIKIPKNASETFHGRDVFALAATKVKNFSKIGKKTKVKKFQIPKNTVVHIDHFGNIVTNIKPKKKLYKICLNSIDYILNVYNNYSKASREELFMVVGSSGTLEISRKEGNANKKIKAMIGDKIEIL
jgi:S-adenosylmethionine hydrolase